MQNMTVPEALRLKVQATTCLQVFALSQSQGHSSDRDQAPQPSTATAHPVYMQGTNDLADQASASKSADHHDARQSKHHTQATNTAQHLLSQPISDPLSPPADQHMASGRQSESPEPPASPDVPAMDLDKQQELGEVIASGPTIPLPATPEELLSLAGLPQVRLFKATVPSMQGQIGRKGLMRIQAVHDEDPLSKSSDFCSVKA